jgi:hypothetical protein
MRLQLALLRTDMWNEGYNPRFLEAKVYRGVEHQDGRTLLALRRFLKSVYTSHPLKTVTLIGDFPESSIARQTLVRSRQVEPRNFGGMMVSNVDYVHSGSELIAPRSDLVLSDLDGNWENLYRQGLATFRDVELVPVLPAGTDFPALEPHLVGGPSSDGLGLFGSDGKPRRVYLNGYGSTNPTGPRQCGPIDSGLFAPDSYNTVLRKADTTFSTSLDLDNADMAEYINWLKEPAVMRGIAAHSDQIGSGYKASNAWLVDAMVGGKPWFWKSITEANGTRYLEPTIGERGVADFHLYRTLWENRIFESMSTGQAFYIHDGCSVNLTPESIAYSVTNYAPKQHAESMHFYANGHGMLARAKVFNDTPKNFTETVVRDKRFAAGLRGYFQADSADPNLNPHTAPDWANRRTRTLQRKRTYFWGLLGDPTLRIKYH